MQRQASQSASVGGWAFLLIQPFLSIGYSPLFMYGPQRYHADDQRGQDCALQEIAKPDNRHINQDDGALYLLFHTFALSLLR